MAVCHWSACRHVPRRVADVRRGVLRHLHRAENAVAQAAHGGWTGSGSSRRLLREPDQTGEPGPLPRAVRAAWAAALQPDAKRRGRRRRYGLSCMGCSAALMVAMVLLGMSSLWWAVILGLVVLIYKFAPPLPIPYELVLSAALVALGVAYVMMA